MGKKIYTSLKKTAFAILLGSASITSLQAQEYADTTGLINDIQAGTYEEYILAPLSVTDTFFIKTSVVLNKTITIRAKEGLGFKPVVTGNNSRNPSYLFQVKDVLGTADVNIRGIHFVNKVRGAKSINNGTFVVYSEGVNLNIVNCNFFDFPSYNAVVKVFNSGGNITLDSVLVYNCGGKIIQVNYKDNHCCPVKPGISCFVSIHRGFQPFFS